MLGLIYVVDRDDQHLITIQFHDQSVQAGQHFNDTFKFTMGALGECCLHLYSRVIHC